MGYSVWLMFQFPNVMKRFDMKEIRWCKQAFTLGRSTAAALLASGLMLTASMGYAQVTAAPSPTKKVAVQETQQMSVGVGEAFPDFTLMDQNNQPLALSKKLEDGPVVLVIYRSADW